MNLLREAEFEVKWSKERGHYVEGLKPADEIFSKEELLSIKAAFGYVLSFPRFRATGPLKSALEKLEKAPSGPKA